MSMWKKLVARFVAMVRGRRIADELDEEVRFHVEMLTQSNIAAGMTPAEARRLALVAFGGVEQTREAARDVRALWVDQFLQDLRYGRRMLLRNPGFSAVAIMTLGLGIGANTGIFSVVNGVMLKPLPVRNADRLAAIGISRGDEPGPLSWPDLLDYRAGATAFEDMAGYSVDFVGLGLDTHAERIVAGYVSGNLFSMLGLQPAVGRLILPGEGAVENADPVVVIGFSYWMQRFGGNPSIVGKVVRVNGQPMTIVGVAPEGFRGPYAFVDMQAYLPMGMTASNLSMRGTMRSREGASIRALGTVKPGVALAQAEASLDVVTRQLAARFPDSHRRHKARVFWETHARPEVNAAESTPLVVTVFLGLVLLVLLVACGNVANLLLVRASVRMKELTLRSALGAGRLRVVRQLLTESLMLSALGGAVGVGLGYGISRALASIRLPVDIPMRLDFGFDWRVFAYTGALVVLTALVAGAFPALRVSSGNLACRLTESGRVAGPGRQRVRDLLLASQVAGSLVLLVAAGLFVRSLAAARIADLGFQPDHVMNFSMDPGQQGYDETRSQGFYRDLLADVRSLPGVESASLAYAVPMGYYNSGRSVLAEGEVAGAANRGIGCLYNVVDSDYRQTMGLRLVGGRWFVREEETGSRNLAVINDALARRLWPGQDAVGKRFQDATDASLVFEVIGVVRTGKVGYIFEEPTPYYYVTHEPNNWSLRVLHVRTAGQPREVVPAVRSLVRSMAPGLPLHDVVSMREAVNGGNGLFLIIVGAVFASTLGALGLVLAVVGLYGVVSYSAGLRTQEIGVRMALGAARPGILRLVMVHGLSMVAIGAGIGTALALAVAQVLKSMLFNVEPYDPLTYASVCTLLGIVAVGACYVPARRATRVDPVVALRCE
jgi:predicted permease